MAEEQKEEKKEEAAKPPRKPLPMQLIMLVTFVLLNFGVMIGGGYLVYSSTIGFHRKAITEETAGAELKEQREGEEMDPVVFTLEPFTVNLDGQPRRILRTVISLELLDEKGFEEVVQLGAEPRDAIVRLLNGKTFTDVEGIQGKLILKDEIASIVNKQMKSGVIKDIYFNEFVVQ